MVRQPEIPAIPRESLVPRLWPVPADASKPHLQGGVIMEAPPGAVVAEHIHNELAARSGSTVGGVGRENGDSGFLAGHGVLL